MKYPRYPSYKSSGVEWLGEVPAHWDVKRGRFAMRVNPSPEKLHELAEDDEVSFVPMEAVGEYGGLDLERTKPIFEIGSSLCMCISLLVSDCLAVDNTYTKKLIVSSACTRNVWTTRAGDFIEIDKVYIKNKTLEIYCRSFREIAQSFRVIYILCK